MGDWDDWEDQVEPLTLEELAEYDPVKAAARRAPRVIYLTGLFAAGAWSNNLELVNSDWAKHLRKFYRYLAHAYQNHDKKWDRGWGVPELMDRDQLLKEAGTNPKIKRGIKQFSWELFLKHELPIIDENASRAAAACLTVYRKPRPEVGKTRADRSVYGSTFQLFHLEHLRVHEVVSS